MNVSHSSFKDSRNLHSPFILQTSLPEASGTKIMYKCKSTYAVFQMLHHALVTNPNTFLLGPEKEYEKQYEAWLEIVEDQLSADRLSKLMASNPELHSQYTALVPSQVMLHCSA